MIQGDGNGMRWVPVLDVRTGIAVRARAGRRDHYRPLVSVLHPEPDPLGLGRALRDLGVSDLYLADLDAITATAPPDLALLESLAGLGLRVRVDAGIRDGRDVRPLLNAGAAMVVAGSETLMGPSALTDVVETAGPERVVFSLDLDAGIPRVALASKWRKPGDPDALLDEALSVGVRHVLILDLARVGLGQGPGGLELLARRSAERPDVEWSIGGGISGPADLEAVTRAGASVVLIGSAWHDGRLAHDLRA